MILLLDTSTGVCRLWLVEGEQRQSYEWEANRELAKGLLTYLHERLEENGKSWSDISSIGVFQGPGSFTGLRIGMTVLNTLADSLNISIVGAVGDAWQDEALRRLQVGENDRVVTPFYGAEAHITKPRK